MVPGLLGDFKPVMVLGITLAIFGFVMTIFVGRGD